jgi:hypothetical protein
MYTDITARWKEITAPHLTNPVHITSQCSVDFQPFPAIIGSESQKRGGNAMGISGDDGDRILLELQCSWAAKIDDQVLSKLSRDMTTWLEKRVTEWLEDEDGQSKYLPFLMNDAMSDQNVTGSYRDYAKLKLLQEEIDPNGLFRERAGGYKY